jgi:hypothetical protein
MHFFLGHSSSDSVGSAETARKQESLLGKIDATPVLEQAPGVLDGGDTASSWLQMAGAALVADVL